MIIYYVYCIKLSLDYKYIIIILSRKLEKETRYTDVYKLSYYCFANDNFHAKQNKVEWHSAMRPTM